MLDVGVFIKGKPSTETSTVKFVDALWKFFLNTKALK